MALLTLAGNRGLHGVIVGRFRPYAGICQVLSEQILLEAITLWHIVSILGLRRAPAPLPLLDVLHTWSFMHLYECLMLWSYETKLTEICFKPSHAIKPQHYPEPAWIEAGLQARQDQDDATRIGTETVESLDNLDKLARRKCAIRAAGGENRRHLLTDSWGHPYWAGERALRSLSHDTRSTDSPTRSTPDNTDGSETPATDLGDLSNDASPRWTPAKETSESEDKESLQHLTTIGRPKPEKAMNTRSSSPVDSQELSLLEPSGSAPELALERRPRMISRTYRQRVSVSPRSEPAGSRYQLRSRS
ncbi:hypothetical protein BJY01DRAFT_242801 [Aspergillus pseudoustus]|uniref:Uncharacterized protein n=1 Tax=Aspergillus pseudoustus TaxID=1810923 RepID=A0ABR4KW00_9EURO